MNRACTCQHTAALHGPPKLETRIEGRDRQSKRVQHSRPKDCINDKGPNANTDCVLGAAGVVNDYLTLDTVLHSQRSLEFPETNLRWGSA